ncbi:ARHGB factor, partial [Nothoprocta ornata]|nr:ARHGB factor [Nothoprocta ornata]
SSWPSPMALPASVQDPEVQKHAAQILRNMLRQEEAELQRFCELHSRNPGTVAEEQIEGARRRVSQLQLKILQETGASAVRLRRGTGARRRAGGHRGRRPRGAPRGRSVHAQLAAARSRRGPTRIPCLPQGLDRPARPLIIGPEEDCDPGYFNNECDSLFQDLGKLKSRPAHLGVFLRYIFSQADPSPLLFYLCADVCQQTSPKDSRLLGKDIWNIFLDRNA